MSRYDIRDDDIETNRAKLGELGIFEKKRNVVVLTSDNIYIYTLANREQMEFG